MAATKTPKSNTVTFKWTPKRVALVKALKVLGATNARGAETCDKIAAKAKLTEQDVKHYAYKDNDLVANGFVAITEIEGETRLGYYATAKGVKALDSAAVKEAGAVKPAAAGAQK